MSEPRKAVVEQQIRNALVYVELLSKNILDAARQNNLYGIKIYLDKHWPPNWRCNADVVNFKSAV
jgi:hypothetical protein